MIPLGNLLLLKFPNIDIIENVRLSDTGDGAGPRIVSWNYADTPMPTQSDLNSWQAEFDLSYRQSIVRATRKGAYPPWNQQLDMQYNDLINNTTTWKDAVAAVKVANPIPTE